MNELVLSPMAQSVGGQVLVGEIDQTELVASEFGYNNECSVEGKWCVVGFNCT